MSFENSETKICIVAAMSKQGRAIGKMGKLLWHIPEDMKRFKNLTTGHPVIMGRKTFESILSYIGKPLPNRTNIVITRNPEYAHSDTTIVSSLSDAFKNAAPLDETEIHIGGGSEIYKQALPYVDRLYLTLVDGEPEADSFFPSYESEFTKILSSEKKEHAGLLYEWITLERN